MNTPSRTPHVSARAKRPSRPLPVAPTTEETNKGLPDLSYLVKDDIHEPFQLLESHPLSLICQYHNVKRVSLEEGVPPPFNFDVPILRSAVENPNALLPTHMLAVYDQDVAPEQSEHSPSLSPHSTNASGRSSLPATPLMIPVNAKLWAVYFTSPLSEDPVPAPSPSPSVPSIGALRRHDRSESTISTSSMRSSRSSFMRTRPRSVLSLPVHVIRVPSAKAFPLLLLSALRILPKNRVMPALLPRKILEELPAPPAILAQHLLRWLYPTQEDWQRRSLDDARSYSPLFRASPMPSLPSGSRSPRRPPSPLLSPSLTPSPSYTIRRLSTVSTSSHLSTRSSISSQPSSASVSSPPVDSTTEPICALADPASADDPDLRLLMLAQQNFGLWADALALGLRDPGVVRLAELAWSVASDARRARFGDPTHASDVGADASSDGAHTASSSLHTRQGRSRSRNRPRPPIPLLDAPPLYRPPSSQN